MSDDQLKNEAKTRIKLTRGKWTIVDDKMFDYLNQFKWYASKEGKYCYVRRGSYIPSPKKILLHHLVIGFPLNKKCVDHINGDTLDNRRENLRIVSVRENALNTKARRENKTHSQYVGVSWHKRDKRWCASIRMAGRIIYLGSFKDERKAGEAYQWALKNLGQ